MFFERFYCLYSLLTFYVFGMFLVSVQFVDFFAIVVYLVSVQTREKCTK